MNLMDRRVLAALEVLDRYERGPCGDVGVAGWAPIDEVREALTGIRQDDPVCRACGGAPSSVSASGVVIHNNCPGGPW